jgi:molybdate transport system substrate-binding protein
LRRLALVLLLVLAACGSDAHGTDGPRVFAAASLTEVFTELGGASFTFAGSSALVTQIEQGAPADVFAAADERTMQRLVDAGMVERPVVFAHNTLEIVTAEGNPEGITGLADLAEPGITVVLADPSVPVGRYSQEALRKAGVTVRPRSLELDVKAVLTKVTTGEVDAGIVYVSDVDAAGDQATGVEIPADENVVADYPIAVVKDAPHPEAARAFIATVRSAAGRDALRRHGFRPA